MIITVVLKKNAILTKHGLGYFSQTHLVTLVVG
jgi:hypothetical protein